MNGSIRGRSGFRSLMGLELAAIFLAVALLPVPLRAQFPARPPEAPKPPWMDKTLSPDKRADMVMEQMTRDEKFGLIHGLGFGFGASPGGPSSGQQTGIPIEQQLVMSRSLGGAGFLPGISRLGLPDLQMADAAVGVTRGASRSRYSTALPDAVSLSASWDPKLAYEYGALIGQELRDQGYNMSLGGGVNITREPRNGRNFEYLGEDPILAGTMVGQHMKGLQAQNVIGDTKHYALNDQETGRGTGNVIIDKRSMRETDLLAFEIALKAADIGAVMCAYNRVNGDYACENSYLLNDVLKKDFGHKGFVLSDWGATHSAARAALAGLDMEMPANQYFGDALKKAVENGEVPMARVDDMVHRILRTMFASGIIDNPPSPKIVNVSAGLEFARLVAEQGAVLLKNANRQLPLDRSKIKSIAVIGSHADVGVLSGGGSAQVDAPGGNAVPPAPEPGAQRAFMRGPVWFPSSPLKAIREKASNTKVEYNSGTKAEAAAALAKASDIAIVFANQPTSEGRDETSLSLPDDQDKLIAAVAAVNPKTIVVLETGGPVTMPWINNVSSILAAWYPGISGAEAIANILFGEVNPAAKLTISFPKSESDLPHPTIAGPPPSSTAPAPGAVPAAAPAQTAPPAGGPMGGMGRTMAPFDISYTEGLKVGYKWYDAENKAPLFPFGFGLSYTTYAYSGLKTTVSGKDVKVSFVVENTGKRAGSEIAQVYVSLPASAGEPPKRLVAWDKVHLDPGKAKTVELTLNPWYLSIFNADKNAWAIVPGDYKVLVGGSSRDLPLSSAFKMNAN